MIFINGRDILVLLCEERISFGHVAFCKSMICCARLLVGRVCVSVSIRTSKKGKRVTRSVGVGGVSRHREGTTVGWL